MKKFRFWKTALVLGVVAVFMCGLAACSSSGSSGAVAATVNGEEILEQDVTDQVESIREQSDLEEDSQWGQFLVENDMTPSSVREQIIDSMVEQRLIKQGAADLGIAVESSEVDEYIDAMKENYDDDEAWNTALTQAGFTEESYRQTIEESLYEQKVGDYFEEKAEVSDEDYVSAAQTYASYYDGAKRSSHILFSVEDTTDEAALAEATSQAQSVLDQINAGSLDFAAAAEQYSGDTSSAEDGGDVGWDVLNSFVDEYTTALDALELNQVSGLVTSDYGVHIIKCTDIFTAPEEVTSLDQIPEAFQENIKEMAVSIKANTDYTDWLDGLKDNADIVINDMPSDLSYDIDLTPYEEAAAAEEEEDADASEDEDLYSVDEDEESLDDSEATIVEGEDTAADEESLSETEEAAAGGESVSESSSTESRAEN